MSYRHNGGPSLEAPAGFDKIGWVAIHRSIRDHWLVGFGKPVAPADPSRGAHSQHEAFGDLIMNCQYNSGVVVNNGRKMRIEPGQLLGGVAWLAARWNWTSKKVRWFLDNLEADGMISRSTPDEKGRSNGTFKGNQKMVITLCNYSNYQFLSGRAQAALTARATDGSGQAIENSHNNTSSISNEGDRGATKRATKRATDWATDDDRYVTEKTDKNTSSMSNNGDQLGNQRGDQKGDILININKDTHTGARAYTRTREEARLEEVSPPKAMVNSDGSFDGVSIELTAEEHAAWRDRFEALSGTWPSPLMVADEFIGAECERQGIRDPRQRKVRVQAYLDKRNREAHALQAQVTATALVKPTPRVNGYVNGNHRAPATDWASAVKAAVAKRKVLPQ